MSLTNMYDFEQIESDEDGMRLASRFDHATSQVVDNLTGWVHRIACKYNDPTKPMMAANAYESYMQGLATFIVSPSAGDDRWLKSLGHKQDFSLTGNSNIANAYKKTLNTIKLGGDLCGADSHHEYGNLLTTVSKCEIFNRKRNTEKKKMDEQAQAVEELHQLVEEQTGLKRGTPEHEEAFQKASLQLVETVEEQEAAEDGRKKDIYDDFGQQFAENLRKLREAGESEQVISDMADAAISRIGKTIGRVLELLEKSAA